MVYRPSLLLTKVLRVQGLVCPVPWHQERTRHVPGTYEYLLTEEQTIEETDKLKVGPKGRGFPGNQQTLS